MKLIKPSFEIKEQELGLNGVYKQIELAGRTCYKSENKITENSAKEFVERMVKLGHGAMLEHGTVYLFLTMSSRQQYFKYCSNPYSVANSTGEAEKGTWNGFVTTNYRVLVENGWLDDLKYLCEPTCFHEKRVCVKFICDRVTGESFLRHRVFSFARESTRYCNYSKDKFNNEITYILPCWIDDTSLQEIKGSIVNQDECGSFISEYYYHLTGKEESWFKPWEITPERNFIASLQIAEQLYLELLNQGWKPQQARTILPFCIKSPLIMTGFVSDWTNFFLLRSNKYGKGGAHPQADELATPLYEEFKNRNLI